MCYREHLKPAKHGVRGLLVATAGETLYIYGFEAIGLEVLL